MPPQVSDFLSRERMCVLAVALADGTPHTAAMHFVYQDGMIYFSTHANSKKVQGLTSAKASVTVGFNEQDWITLQVDGIIEKTESGKDLILAKYSQNAKYMDDSAVFLKFTPTWHRYTNFKATPPEIIEGK